MLKTSKTIFKANTHQYFNEHGKELSGITPVLSKHLFQGKYDNCPEDVLEKARIIGSLVHQEISDYITKGEHGFTDEFQAFLEEYGDWGYELTSEFVVSDGEDFATCIDIVEEHHDAYYLIDIKKTYELDMEYLSWQLSFGKYLFEKDTGLKVLGLKAIWLKDGKCINVDVPEKDPALIERLIQCELNGELYKEECTALSVPDASKLVTLTKRVEKLKEEQKSAKAELDAIKEQFEINMNKAGITTIDHELFKVTLTKDYTKESLDTTSLKKDNLNVYKKYLRTTPVKGGVKITLKKEKKEYE